MFFLASWRNGNFVWDYLELLMGNEGYEYITHLLQLDIPVVWNLEYNVYHNVKVIITL